MGEDLDALIRRVDPDRWLASRFIADTEARADVIALYAFDHELRRAAQATSQPTLAEIRLTWWAEALDEIYAGAPVRKHPVTEALARAIGRGALPREPLDAAIDSRIAALDAVAEAETAAAAIAEAAAVVLDPEVDRAAVRAVMAGERRRARRVSAAAFPAVAHVALGGRRGTELGRRLRLTWAVATGRL